MNISSSTSGCLGLVQVLRGLPTLIKGISEQVLSKLPRASKAVREEAAREIFSTAVQKTQAEFYDPILKQRAAFPAARTQYQAALEKCENLIWEFISTQDLAKIDRTQIELKAEGFKNLIRSIEKAYASPQDKASNPCVYTFKLNSDADPATQAIFSGMSHETRVKMVRVGSYLKEENATLFVYCSAKFEGYPVQPVLIDRNRTGQVGFSTPHKSTDSLTFNRLPDNTFLIVEPAVQYWLQQMSEQPTWSVDRELIMQKIDLLTTSRCRSIFEISTPIPCSVSGNGAILMLMGEEKATEKDARWFRLKLDIEEVLEGTLGQNRSIQITIPEGEVSTPEDRACAAAAVDAECAEQPKSSISVSIQILDVLFTGNFPKLPEQAQAAPADFDELEETVEGSPKAAAAAVAPRVRTVITPEMKSNTRELGEQILPKQFKAIEKLIAAMKRVTNALITPFADQPEKSLIVLLTEAKALHDKIMLQYEQSIDYRGRLLRRYKHNESLLAIQEKNEGKLAVLEKDLDADNKVLKGNLKKLKGINNSISSELREIEQMCKNTTEIDLKKPVTLAMRTLVSEVSKGLVDLKAGAVDLREAVIPLWNMIEWLSNGDCVTVPDFKCLKQEFSYNSLDRASRILLDLREALKDVLGQLKPKKSP